MGWGFRRSLIYPEINDSRYIFGTIYLWDSKFQTNVYKFSSWMTVDYFCWMVTSIMNSGILKMVIFKIGKSSDSMKDRSNFTQGVQKSWNFKRIAMTIEPVGTKRWLSPKNAFVRNRKKLFLHGTNDTRAAKSNTFRECNFFKSSNNFWNVLWKRSDDYARYSIEPGRSTPRSLDFCPFF